MADADENSYELLYKIIIIGDTGVGKSNILSRYVMGKFNPEHEITIGCEFMAKNIEIKDRNIRIQIWDDIKAVPLMSIKYSILVVLELYKGIAFVCK